MNWYRLYVSSVGGGTICEGPFKFISKDIATQAAYDIAVEDYESFEGLHGIPDVGDIMEDKEGYNLSEDASEDECWEVYYEQRESWLSYWAEEASGPDDKDEDYQ
jgi:hypothetical protein